MVKKSKVERQPSGARPADLVPLPVVRLGIDQDGRPMIDVDWLIDFLTTYVRPRALSPISVRAAARPVVRRPQKPSKESK